MKDKKGVSEVVAYVLLISISFALAGMVYAWLKFYVSPHEEVKCDEGVSLIIRNYYYNCSANNLTLTLQNRGLFNIDGFVVRANNRSGSNIGVFTLNRTGKAMQTGETFVMSLNSNSVDPLVSLANINGNLYFVEVQPYQYKNGQTMIFCSDSITTYSISCS